MVDEFQIDDAVRRRLQDRAAEEGCTVNTLLERLLTEAPNATPSPYAYLDAAPFAIVIVDVSLPDQPIIYANPAFEEQTGYSREEIVGRRPRFLQDIDRDQPDRTQLREAIDKQQPGRALLRNYRKDGTLFWNEMRIAPLHDADGTLYIGIQNDVTERIQAEQRLTTNERFVNSILRAVPSFIYIYDFLEDRNVFANEGLTTILGYTPEELQAMGSNALPQLVHPDDMKALLDNIRRVRATTDDNYFYKIAYRLRHKDGSYRWIQDQGVVFKRTAHGDVQQILGSVIDIQGQKQAEEALRESEARYRTLAENHPDGLVALYDHDLRYTVINGKGLRDIGMNPADMEGKRLRDIFPPEIYERDEPALLAALNGQRTESLLPYGDQFFRVITIPVRNPNGDIIKGMVVSQNITELKRAEDERRKSEEKYRLIAENTSDGIAIIGGDPYQVLYASPAYDRQWGRSPGASVGLTQEEIYEYIHPDDRDTIFTQVFEAILSKAPTLTYRYRGLHSDGQYRWKEDHTHFHYDADGRQMTAYVICRDITERVEAEQLKIEHERLTARVQREQEQNALTQQTISALSHDIRTPLSVIATTKDMLSRYSEHLSKEQRTAYLDKIGTQLQYAVELLDDTVQMVRNNMNYRDFRPAPTHLATLCRISMDEISSVFPTRHRFTYDERKNVGIVLIDEVLVSRILLNLLSNAVKYSPDGSEVRLELDQDEGWLLLRVVDQGMGIAPDNLPYIFDPFYRTQQAGSISGTGLGLSIVKTSVERHQGQLHVDSEPGRGSTFTVKLPWQPGK